MYVHLMSVLSYSVFIVLFNLYLIKGIVHFEMIFLCFSLPQGHPRCRCLCFHSIFNFGIF